MQTPMTRAERRRWRAEVATTVAQRHGGVAHRRDLRAAGVGRFDVRTEVRAGRWTVAGRHTVVVGGGAPAGDGVAWAAVWESGPGARLDGAAALVAAGLRGYRMTRLDVTVPWTNDRHAWDGARVRRSRAPSPVADTGIPRVRPVPAVIHAVQWASTDRQAALLVCLAVQQRLVRPAEVLAAWERVRRTPRRAMLDGIIRDVCDGAHSLGELDFAHLCRRRGLPPPSRQAVRATRSGRVYLDAAWDVGLAVEIDGGHHAMALHPIDDALRQDEVTLDGVIVLRASLLVLRLAGERFLDQIERAYAAAAARSRAA